MQKIGVLGAGTMGAGIAQTFATAGLNVVLRDVSEDLVSGGLSIVRKNLDRQVAKGTLPEIEHQAILGRIQAATDLTAVADCDLVVEAIIESMDIKKIVFSELDAICQPSTLFVSNTSSLSITEIASATNRPDQVMGMHFFNPAPVMKLVELIRGIATAQTTVDAVQAVAIQIGKQPVEVAEAPGFVVNRILVPMINEAVYTLYEGVGSVQSIDQSMKLGANHPMGPLELADFIGLDTCLAIMNVLHDGLADTKYRPCPLLTKYVEAGWLSRKSKRGCYD